ncbi:MAG: hypothetical protein GXP52_00490 [Deltaproteobacteria bacterium]|nr:hypothetical protein [Deltaproteobacteria bacterium]
MHGEIKLGRWLPFTAEQVIHRDRGMLWCATVRMFGLPVRGFDSYLDGQGEMRWKMLGLIPIVTGSGPDISRSALGRLQAELVWLPSALCGPEVSWTSSSEYQTQAEFHLHGHAATLELAVDSVGRLHMVKMIRWGNPSGGAYESLPFGGIVEDESRFGGYTVPSRLRVGWYLGTERFDTEGDFFHVTVDDAVYRCGRR